MGLKDMALDKMAPIVGCMLIDYIVSSEDGADEAFKKFLLGKNWESVPDEYEVPLKDILVKLEDQGTDFLVELLKGCKESLKNK